MRGIACLRSVPRVAAAHLFVIDLQDEFAVTVYEEIVRFHIMCEHELAGEDQSGAFEGEELGPAGFVRGLACFSLPLAFCAQ